MNSKRNRKTKTRRINAALVKGKGVARRVRRGDRDVMNLESLECRQLMSVVNVADFGAKPNDGQNDLAAVQQAVNSAKDGDTIMFAAGEYDFSGTLNVPSNRTLSGAANHASKLVFNTATNAFAIQLQGASNITIDGLSLKANDGVIVAWDNTNNVNITNDDFVWGYNGTYYNRLGVRAAGANTGLIIDHNNFHDSTSSDRNVDLYDLTNSSYSYNTFTNVHDGGHVDGTTTNFNFVGNVGTGIQRMGLELQDHNSTTSNNILIANNVFTNWRDPDNWSFGLSIMPQNAHNVTIKNNYLSTGSQSVIAGNHYGYGIESGFTSGIVQGNTLIGPWVSAITCSMQNTQLQGNKVYGSNAWGPFTGEPGLNGTGSVMDLGGNQGNLPMSSAPPVPTSGSPVSDSKLGVKNVAVQVLSDTSVKLTWTNASITVTSVQIDVISTISRQSFPSVMLNGAATSATITGLTPGWQMDFTVTANTATLAYTAAPVTAQLTGSSGTTTTPPPPPDDTIQSPTDPSIVDLTTIKPESSSNGWGPYEKDMSNGEQAAGDGKTIAIEGQKYATGFGVHAPSTLQFKLSGKYTSFATVIGIDDEAGGGGSVIFRVYGDGKKLFDSGVVTGTDAARKIMLNVTGVQKLKLVVISSNGSINNDHADWAMPLLTKNTAGAVGATPTKNPKRYMEHMNIASAANKLGDPQVNESAAGHTQTINGQTFTKGIGVTASSKLVYALNGKYKYFASYIGMDDETKSWGTVSFQVWGDGHMLYNSGDVNNDSHLRKVKVNVQGVNQLWLVVTPAQGGAKNASLHADWAQSYLLAA